MKYMREVGVYQNLGPLSYFIPHNLPPNNSVLQMNNEIMLLYGEASFALGQLNEMSRRLPDQKRFIKAYVTKEALLSSSIEGIHTTLTELFNSNLEDFKLNKSTQLVLNYTYALDKVIEMITEQELPISTRVILKAHEILMNAGEGDKSAPGQFRKQQVSVGELVPPLAPLIADLMNNLEQYINEQDNIPPLIKAGLVHVQFEIIHPFLDGNGRIGRLLIVLMLINSNLLKLPIVYPSYFFKKHHLEYYQKLDLVRTNGDFEGWITYYLEAIRDSAIDAYMRAKDIENLENQLIHLIQTDPAFIKMRNTAMSLLMLLFSNPVTDISTLSNKLNLAYNTVSNILKILNKQNIITENILKKRNKIYSFTSYLALLEKEYTIHHTQRHF